MVRRHAKTFALFEVVKFEHDTVNLVGMTAAFARPCNGGLVQ